YAEALIMLRKGKSSEQASALLDQALSLNAKFLPALMAKGQVAFAQQDYAQALTHYNEALQLNPKSLPALVGAADSALAMGLVERAAGLYEQGLELAPDSVLLLNNLAWCLGESGQRLDVALQYAEKASQLAPKVSGVRDTLGWVLLKRGETKEALLEFELARDLSPKDPLPHYHMAQAFMKLGKPDQAKPVVKAALELGVGFPGKIQAEKLLQELGG
ncbi:MAG: tetratricopeptide repeat protein, partial [Nitrospira sp.]|nr:tetratricopeptide repeat protein [Nitrospira sp.]